MRIEARLLPEHCGIEALYRCFGRHILTVESRIYDCMSQFSAAYSGGCWHFYILSNGGFYMSPPDGVYEIHIEGNGFQGRMSADASGITVCLYTYSQLSFEPAPEIFAKHFHWLRDFARHHAEARAIFQAID
jgi:Antirestriction protein